MTFNERMYSIADKIIKKIEKLTIYFIEQIIKTLDSVLFHCYKKKLRTLLSPFAENAKYVDHNIIDHEPYFLESRHEEKYIKGTIIVSEFFLYRIASTIADIISEIPKISNVDSFEEKEKVIELVSILEFTVDSNYERREIDLISFKTEGKVVTSNEIEVFCHSTVEKLTKIIHEYEINNKNEVSYIIIKIFY